MYTLIRSISAGVSEIIRFERSNTLWIVKFLPGNECAVMTYRTENNILR